MWLLCCVWAVVCQVRLVWFLCKNILSRSVCQEARWSHWPMRGVPERRWPIRGKRELCLRCGEMFGLNLALFEFLRLYPRFYQVPAHVTWPDILNLCHQGVSCYFLHPWLTFFRQNMIRTTISIARRIPQMMQSVINKASFVFSFIINSSEYLYLEKLKYLKMDWKWNFHPKYLRSLEHWLHSGYWLFYPKVLSKIKFLSQPEPSVS